MLKMKILVIDNYDSFTYNIVQVFGELGTEVSVFRNDALSLGEAIDLQPTHLVISPGPGDPTQSGISNDLIRHFSEKISVLGVCLGHQCLAYAFGGKVIRSNRIIHGKTSKVYHDGKTIYQGLLNPFPATRYHSLIVEEESLPSVIEVTAHTSEGEIMGIRLKDRPVEGVQFHPESILTKEGCRLLSNFIEMT